MKKHRIDKLAAEWWAVAIAAMRKNDPKHAFAITQCENVSPITRKGWYAVVRHAVKTINREEE